MSFKLLDQMRKLSPQKFFVQLCYLPRDAGQAIPQDGEGVSGRFRHALGCFVENQRAVFDAQPLEGPFPFAAAFSSSLSASKFVQSHNSIRLCR